jgi:hypothetical protein
MDQDILHKCAREQGGTNKGHLTSGDEMHGANHCPELIIITEVPLIIITEVPLIIITEVPRSNH